MTTQKTDRQARIAQIMAEATRRGAVLADVNNLTDAYRLKVLEDAVKELKKSMAERGSAVPLLEGGDRDHDAAS